MGVRWLAGLLAIVVASIALACQAPPASGASCVRNAECAAPLVCRIDRCRTECAAQRDCPAGARCLLDADGHGACSLASDVCTETAECGGLACIDGRCENPCASVVDCAIGSFCVSEGGRARCVRPDAVDAAITPHDGGVGGCAPRHGAIAIASGSDHSCAIREDGIVVCWGIDISGQLGDGDTTSLAHGLCGTDDCSGAPVAVLRDDGTALHATQIASGRDYTCALEAMSQEVYCWGDVDVRGAMPGPMLGRATRVVDGNGRAVDASASPIVSLRAGFRAMYVLHADGTIEGWGRNDDSQLGVDAATFVIEELSEPRNDAIVAGDGFVCVLAMGNVRCIGKSNAGLFGGTIAVDARSTTPVSLPLDAASAVAAGVAHLCARVDGNSVCLGSDQFLQLGTSVSGAACSCTQTPVYTGTSPPFLTFDAIYATTAGFVTCGRTGTRLWCWGANGQAQTGQPAGSDVPAPAEVHGLVDAPVDVGTGSDTTCVLLADHHVMCMGANDRGQMGIGATDFVAHDVPATVCLDLPTD
jgi:alpha-tubulin suppressor-like RCC1 family protein